MSASASGDGGGASQTTTTTVPPSVAQEFLRRREEVAKKRKRIGDERESREKEEQQEKTRKFGDKFCEQHDFQAQWRDLLTNRNKDKLNELNLLVPATLLALKANCVMSKNSAQKEFFRNAMQRVALLLDRLAQTKDSASLPAHLLAMCIVIVNVLRDDSAISKDEKLRNAYLDFVFGQLETSAESGQGLRIDDPALLLTERHYSLTDPTVDSRPPCRFLSKSACEVGNVCQWNAGTRASAAHCRDPVDKSKRSSCRKYSQEDSEWIVTIVSQISNIISDIWPSITANMRKLMFQDAATLTTERVGGYTLQSLFCAFGRYLGMGKDVFKAVSPSLVIGFVSYLPMWSALIPPDVVGSSFASVTPYIGGTALTALAAERMRRLVGQRQSRQGADSMHACTQPWQDPQITLSERDRAAIEEKVKEMESWGLTWTEKLGSRFTYCAREVPRRLGARYRRGFSRVKQRPVASNAKKT